ncbi:TrbG/VirB9 family P-type conjugative transfer protein [Aurantiacibacter gangjinensis]|uniref:Type VI secretion protein n=1 Tax=Aurantiacibacter gangjinensis TaxID=502682 RepID=A0A0G9MM66_9SPHN|nr:TrbG/VirB9 family P-type conjugative transfer protein [Aurantiacibacter gangjinensis]APE27851.1 Forms the bulk of type IV secretion complex that spans outer membrane and periplasm (VirB9) [Aurantiacibacter gangjinensis]KLE31826.1 type VI secretion protein [Aurantiacibacter gangjinensis]
MIRALVAAGLLASITLAGPAAAQDPRLVERLYDPGEVVRIEGRTNVQSTIRFGEGEAIENVAVGDSQSWQITPNRRANLLFVKPLAPRATTNMTVVTNRHTYLFDLVASPSHRTPLYVLTFTYPVELRPLEEDDGPALASAYAEGPNALELAAANDDYAVVDPTSLNFDWESSGTSGLWPERIYDDGSATFMEWPAGQPMPAILVKDHQGTEGPVNFAVRGDVIVLDVVPSEIILRSGEDVALLTNRGPVGAVNADGTSQSDG